RPRRRACRRRARRSTSARARAARARTRARRAHPSRRRWSPRRRRRGSARTRRSGTRCRTSRPGGSSSTLLRCERDLTGARVVGFARWLAGDLLDDEQRAGHLVTRDSGAAVVRELVERRWVRRVTRLNDRRDRLAPAVVVDADHEHVVDVRVCLERRLDLLGVDLLAAGVDALRAAAQQRHRAVVLEAGVVAGDRVALAVDLDEGCRGLLGILVV